MKHIDSAVERLKTKVNSTDLSLLERILVSEPDPKTAYVLALDLILVGIDTVSITSMISYQHLLTSLKNIYIILTKPP